MSQFEEDAWEDESEALDDPITIPPWVAHERNDFVESVLKFLEAKGHVPSADRVKSVSMTVSADDGVEVVDYDELANLINDEIKETFSERSEE